MPAFVIIALTIIVGLHVVVFWRVAVAPAWPRRAKQVIAIACAVLFVLFVSSWRSLWAPVLSPAAGRPLAWAGMLWLAFGFYLALGLLVVAGVAGVALLRGRADSKPLRIRINRIGSLVAMAVSAVVTGWGIGAAGDPHVTSWTVRSAQLPAEFDGTRIVLLSDLHAGSIRSAQFTEEIVALTNAQDPDLVILAGDLIEGPADRYAAEIAPLAKLDAPLGVFAVTGNHEFISGQPAHWIEQFEQLGIQVLQNETVLLEQDGAAIHLAGVHDLHANSGYTTDPQAALATTTEQDFVLLVAHQPQQALDAQGYGVDLQLSGHTHGGQLWPMDLAVAAAQPMVDGFHDVGDVPVLTSRGVGTWGPPVRVGAEPEIPVITLERA